MELWAFGEVEVGIFRDAEFVRLGYGHLLRLADNIVTVHIVLLIWTSLLAGNGLNYLVLLVFGPLEAFLFFFGQAVLLGVEQIGNVH